MARPKKNKFDFTNGEFRENILRVDNLILAYVALKKNNVGDNQMRDDVLRATIVFLHSTLEEVIRNLLILRVPNSSSEVLSKIPFVMNSNRRPEKIHLGELTSYRGKFVENVIIDSVDKYVDSMSINNQSQLIEFLGMASIPLEKLPKYFSNLEKLMKRRHQIVHQMDRTNELDPLLGPVSRIGMTFVTESRAALTGFYRTLNGIVNRLDLQFN